MSRFVRVLTPAILAALFAFAPAAVRAAPLIATTTSVTVNPATADAGAEGGSISWTINVTPAGSGPVTGTGTWTLSGPGGPIATDTFDPSQANVTITAAGLSAGAYTLTADYAGDATFAASSGFAVGTFAMVGTIPIRPGVNLPFVAAFRY